MHFDSDSDVTSLQNESLKQLEFYRLLDIISNYAGSELGKELILNSYPNNELFWLRREHSLIQEMIVILTEDDALPLENIKDIRPLLYKSQVANAILSTDDILSVRDVIRTSRLIKNWFRNKAEIYAEFYEESELLTDNRLLEKHISEAIDDTSNLKDNASRELARIRSDIREKSDRLRSRIRRIMKKVSDDDMLREDFVTIREGRFVLPVKIENKRQVPGIIHSVSQTGSTVFLEPSEIIEMNNDLSLLLNEEKREIYRILQNLTSEIGSEAKDFLKNVDILAHFDSVFAKARYALDNGGIKPEIISDSRIELINIRHPLLVHSKGSKHVMPLSIFFDGQKRGHLISGPNAGGKTVALKSIGLNIAMALSGIFPLGSCTTNYRTIFSAIGDNQSIENDLSTFSSQISQLKKILDRCSYDSLVLVDEIGSGTDPQEGSALAAGIIDSFININLFFVVTTHQSSLKSYALTQDVIENASLEFSEEQLSPTYKFLSNIPGNSYAFVLAENLGIPNNILRKAKSYLGDKHTQIEESIRILQKVRSDAEAMQTAAKQEYVKAEALRKEYELKFKDIKSKRSVLMEKARQEAAELVRSANALIENTIKEIREQSKEIATIKKDFNEQKDAIVGQLKESADKNQSTQSVALQIGDSVTLEDSSAVGTVLEVDSEHNTALVDFNGVKFRLPFEQFIKTKPEKKKRSTSSNTSSTVTNVKYDSSISIDLRGRRVDECLRMTDEFISNALLSNISPLTIIHGKGTGALRAAVQEFLSNHPSVKSFRSGTIHEGGDGITVVEI